MPKSPIDDIENRIMPLAPIVWVESPHPKPATPKQERVDNDNESISESNS